VLPAALSGIFAAFVLAISRAIGETMAVTLAAGATPNLTLNPLESIQTMTSYIVQVSLGDTPAGTLSYKTLFAVAAVLFSLTLVLNVLANYVMTKYQEVYE
jgi:phosphate transport system permease protein